jgi:hypothetical protein
MIKYEAHRRLTAIAQEILEEDCDMHIQEHAGLTLHGRSLVVIVILLLGLTANAEVEISYTLEEPGNVSLAVYDNAGTTDGSTNLPSSDQL